MARCDAGYFCYQCGEYVEDITESELYLRYVLGEIPYERLRKLPDGHIRCEASLAQFIVDPGFEPVEEEREYLDKRRMDPAEVARREERVTRGWRRLQEIPSLELAIEEYPLEPEGKGE